MARLDSFLIASGPPFANLDLEALPWCVVVKIVFGAHFSFSDEMPVTSLATRTNHIKGKSKD